MNFWQNTYRISGGRLVNTATAMAMPHSLPPSALINICKASGRVYISLSCKTKRGQKYSFHELIKNRIATAITEGLISGRITRRRMTNGLATGSACSSAGS